jgi:hypothetical protein
MTTQPNQNKAISLGSLFLIYIIFLTSCAPKNIEFVVKHLRDQTGEQITEVLSYQTNAAFDNSGGAAPLQVQIDLERKYRNQIIERINAQNVSAESVRNKIAELYKLSPNDPEGTIETALCPLSVVIPAGAKAIVTVEWTERWAEGVINEGTGGEGDQLGTYKVFLGYIEPCSLIKQDNVSD